MARTVDPARHRQRRLVIIDAALTRFAADGYDRTSTASICREAGIGSGTFFHYFPTKLDLLLAILELGAEETAQWFADHADSGAPRAQIEAYVEHVLVEYADPRVAGFVKAVGSVLGEPQVVAALAVEPAAVRAGLTELLTAAQHEGSVRDDRPADVLAQWIGVVLDGFLDALALDETFTVDDQASMLRETVGRLLDP